MAAALVCTVATIFGTAWVVSCIASLCVRLQEKGMECKQKIEEKYEQGYEKKYGTVARQEGV